MNYYSLYTWCHFLLGLLVRYLEFIKEPSVRIFNIYFSRIYLHLFVLVFIKKIAVKELHTKLALQYDGGREIHGQGRKNENQQSHRSDLLSFPIQLGGYQLFAQPIEIVLTIALSSKLDEA
jgi:hypothetical protein